MINSGTNATKIINGIPLAGQLRENNIPLKIAKLISLYLKNRDLERLVEVLLFFIDIQVLKTQAS